MPTTLPHSGTISTARPPQEKGLARLGAWTGSHLRAVLVLWLLVLVGFGAFAPQVELALSGAGWASEPAPTGYRCPAALSGPLAPKEMGIILAVAVFLDALCIRLIVLPVVPRLSGHAAWHVPH